MVGDGPRKPNPLTSRLSYRQQGKVVLVTGASRGIGKGIALQLCAAGATVYITGRTLNHGDANSSATGTLSHLGSLAQTAAEASAKGGACIPVQCDHGDDESTKRVFDLIEREHGRLDLLVNNAYAAADAVPIGIPFFEKPTRIWDDVHGVGLRSHYIASVYAAQLMTRCNRASDGGATAAEPSTCNGAIFNVSSAAGIGYLFDIAYGVGKAAVDRLACDMAHELRPYNIACLSLWPGAVKTEFLLAKDMKVGEQSMPEDRMETPEFTGLAVAALLQDGALMKKSGSIFQCSELAEEYGFPDITGATVPPLIPTEYVNSTLGGLRNYQLKLARAAAKKATDFSKL